MNQVLTKISWKDLASDQEVRWCPGCGDYAILKCVQKTLAELNSRRENTVFVSGIGCSSRFPYYMNTYGFHTIHGRAPAFATGIKLANPELDVWVITGDGDGLRIGGNHLIHAIRRNINLQILLFNNEIYGLTKGQYSPTSRQHTISPSSPRGSVDAPLSPCALALGAGARFIARSIDTDSRQMNHVLIKAQQHRGTSFVEIFQNCIVYNDGVFGDFTDRKQANKRQLHLQHGKPMTFGEQNEFGLRLNTHSLQMEIIKPGENNYTMDDVLVHDEQNRILAQLLVQLQGSQFPIPLGVLLNEPRNEYTETYGHQYNGDRESTAESINSLLRSGPTWTVEN